MTQVYSVPSRESGPYALPDVEVFYLNQNDVETFAEDGNYITGPGWYYWYCLPGCLPDSVPYGPFDSEAEATSAAQEDSWQFEDDAEDSGDSDISEEELIKLEAEDNGDWEKMGFDSEKDYLKWKADEAHNE